MLTVMSPVFVLIRKSVVPAAGVELAMEYVKASFGDMSLSEHAVDKLPVRMGDVAVNPSSTVAVQ